MSMWRADVEQKELARELAKIATRLLRNAFKQAGDDDEGTNYPTLAREVKRLVGDERWQWSPTAAAIQVILVAIEGIPETFTGRNPEKPNQQEGKNGYKGKAERATAKFLYGYRHAEVPKRVDDEGREVEISYKDYLIAASKFLGYDVDSRNADRAFQVVRQDLAAAILDLAPHDVLSSFEPGEDRKADSSSIPTLGSYLAHQPAYERRVAYHDRFKELIECGNHIVILAGDRGNGKSRLALELVADYLSNDAPMPYVFAESTAAAIRDIKAILSAVGRDIPSIDIQDLAPQIAAFLSSEEAPQWMVLDNVEDYSTLERLLPSAIRSRVVVTSSLLMPTYAHATIQVNSMEPGEAYSLARRQLPDAMSGELHGLVGRLEYRPLPIVQVAAFIAAEPVVDIEVFLQDLEVDAAAALDAPAPMVFRTLTALYERTLSLMQKRSNTAAELLEHAACLAPDAIPSDLLREAMRVSGKQLTVTSFQGLILELESRFLLRRIGVTVSMHSLTQQLIRSLVKLSLQRLCKTLHTVLSPRLGELKVGRILTGDQVGLLSHGVKIVEGVLTAEVPPELAEDLLNTCTTLHAGFQQVGDNDKRMIAESLGSRLYNPAKPLAWRRFALSMMRVLLGVGIIGLDFKARNLPSKEPISRLLSEFGVVEQSDAARRLYTVADFAGLDYIALLERTLHIKMRDVILGRSALPVEETVLCLLALMNDSKHSQILRLANSQRRHVFEQMHASTVFDVAEFLAVCGKALLELGELKVADESLSRAEVILASGRGDEFGFIRQGMGIYAIQLDLLLVDGASDEKLLELERQALAVWNNKPQGYFDALTEVRLLRISGRVHAAIAVRATDRSPGGETTIDPARSNGYVIPGRSLQASFKKCTSILRARGDEEAVLYDLQMMYWLSDLLTGAELIEDATSLYPRVHAPITVVDNRTRLKLLLLGFKIALVDDETLPRKVRARSVSTLRRLADQFGNKEMEYWYAEAIATLALVSLKGGERATGLINAACESYEHIGRLDRRDALREAAALLLQDDVISFRKNLWYLVTW